MCARMRAFMRTRERGAVSDGPAAAHCHLRIARSRQDTRHGPGRCRRRHEGVCLGFSCGEQLRPRHLAAAAAASSRQVPAARFKLVSYHPPPLPALPLLFVQNRLSPSALAGRRACADSAQQEVAGLELSLTAARATNDEESKSCTKIPWTRAAAPSKWMQASGEARPSPRLGEGYSRP